MVALVPLFFFLATTVPLAVYCQDLSERSLYETALRFTRSEGEVEERRKILSNLSERTTDFSVMQLGLGQWLDLRDREALISTVKRLVERMNCSKNSKTAICVRLRELWVDHLANAFFFDATASEILSASRLVEKGECEAAEGQLVQLKSREGRVMSVLELEEKILLCKHSIDAATKIRGMIQELRMFE